MPVTTFTPPSDCSTVNLGTIAQDTCFPKQKLSELTYMFLGRGDAISFVDVLDAEEWADRLSQSSTPPVGSSVAAKDLIRKIAIIGDLPAPALQEKDISGGRKHSPYKDFTVNFEIDDVDAEEYEFFRNSQYGIVYVKAWLKTKGGELLGGNAGLNGGTEVRMIAWPIFGKGPDEIVKIVGTLTWRGQVAPDRCVSPV